MAGLLLILLIAAAAAPVRAADPERGHALNENHCRSCHSSKVHNRKQRWRENVEQLRGEAN